MNSAPSPVPPRGNKDGLASSVVHQPALGQNISLAGRHTTGFIAEHYLWNKDAGIIDLCDLVQREAEVFALSR